MKRKRVGPAMTRVLAYVTRNPGCSMFAAAKHAYAGSYRAPGYNAAHRAVKARIVRKEPGPRGYTWILFTA